MLEGTSSGATCRWIRSLGTHRGKPVRLSVLLVCGHSLSTPGRKRCPLGSRLAVVFLHRKNAVELELAKCKMDMMSLNSQLLDAIQQKLNLSQQLEAWQVERGHESHGGEKREMVPNRTWPGAPGVPGAQSLGRSPRCSPAAAAGTGGLGLGAAVPAALLWPGVEQERSQVATRQGAGTAWAQRSCG